MQGRLTADVRHEVNAIIDDMSLGGTLTEYGENRYPVVPRVESVALARGNEFRWWAKLDDDAAIEPSGWDRLIDCIHDANAQGQRVLCAIADPGGNRGPQMLMQEAGGTIKTVRVVDNVVPSGNVRGAHWAACDFVGDGCTVFDLRRMVNIGYDLGFALGGADIDLAMQARLCGFKSLFCGPPYTAHTHDECSPQSYTDVRRDVLKIAASSKLFRQKWGAPCSQLLPAEKKARALLRRQGKLA